MDLMDDDELNEFYKQEGIVNDNDYVNIITIYFSTKSVNTFIQKRVSIIIIE